MGTFWRLPLRRRALLPDQFSLLIYIYTYSAGWWEDIPATLPDNLLNLTYRQPRQRPENSEYQILETTGFGKVHALTDRVTADVSDEAGLVDLHIFVTVVYDETASGAGLEGVGCGFVLLCHSSSLS